MNHKYQGVGGMLRKTDAVSFQLKGLQKYWRKSHWKAL